MKVTYIQAFWAAAFGGGGRIWYLTVRH